MSIAWYYVDRNNPEGAHIDGVPLRDLEEEEFAALPEYLQRSVQQSPFYRKTKPPAESAAKED